MIQVADPAREYRAMADEIDRAMRRVARSGRYVCGPEHEAFESEFADHVGVGHAVGTGNGTDALEIALRALGCGHGDEVITVANAGGFAVAATLAVGATPVFVDVTADLLLADVAQMEASVGPRTAAVVVTHLYGQLHPEIERIASRCADLGVPLVEDCAQAFGALSGARHAGTFGDAGAFSFYPTKNLGAMGDGGMLCTADAALARAFRVMGRHGLVGGDDRASSRRNSRLDELQAAILRVKLRRVDELVARRRAVARAHRAAAPDRWWAGLPDASFAAHLSITRSADRERLRSAAAARGIATSVRFDPPDHLGPAGAPVVSLPETERACAEVVAFPCHAFLSEDELETVCDFLSGASGR